MKVHNIKINTKYFEPIRDKKISLLVFKKKVIHDEQPGDYILASHFSYDIKAKISGTYIKAFKDITEEEAQRAGFLSKEFLKDELISAYNLTPVASYTTGDTIDDELFFLVEINKNEKENIFLTNMKPYKVNLFSKNYNKEFYNSETNEKTTWRDLC